MAKPIVKKPSGSPSRHSFFHTTEFWWHVK